MASGPPYLPNGAVMGGEPTVSVDVPICAVIVLFYAVGAAGNLIFFRRNWSRGHRFRISAFLFAFCISRVVTNVMRIVWATRHQNVSIAIVAQVLVNASVLILYLVNLIFARRLLEASRPSISSNLAFRSAFIALYVLLILMLAAVITVAVQSFYTLNPYTLQIDRDVLLVAITILTTMTFLPIPLMLAAAFFARRKPSIEFSLGSWRSKLIILLTGTLLAITIAGFKCGTAWERPRPKNNAAWFHSKPAFYMFGFVPEILYIYSYLFFRVDKRFHVLGKAESRKQSCEKSLKHNRKDPEDSLEAGQKVPKTGLEDGEEDSDKRISI